MQPKPHVLVAAGVIIEAGRVLLTQRKSGTHLAGAWEFPGGKVEADEDPRDALARELREEIGIDALVGDPIEATFHRYSSKSVLLIFFAASRRVGSAEPTVIDVAALRWAARDELEDALFPAADVAVLRKVRGLL